MKSEAAQRNKRMFQGLNTYLDKAKNKLQQEKTKVTLISYFRENKQIRLLRKFNKNKKRKASNY